MTAADAAAQALGVRPGMAVAQAQAMTAGLDIRDADPAGDAVALKRLAAWALRYTPVVAADPPDGLVLDVAGASHLAGGEAALLDDLCTRLARAGVAARGAIADTWAAAWGLARYAPGTITPVGAGVAAVAGLPVAALRLEPDLVRALRGLGFDTVGELVAAPRRSLALRFGTALMGRLDAIAGRAHESIVPVLPPSIPHARLVIAEPLGHLRGLEIAVERLASQLCEELDQRSLGARRLDLRLRHVDHRLSALRVGTSRATHDAAHIIRLFRERLPTIDPGCGVEDAVLVASQVERLEFRQLATPFTEHETADLAVLVDCLAGRVGAHRIYRLAPVESDIPERSVTRVPALAPATGRSWADGPRPQRLFEPPEPIRVVALLPDHPPVLYVWKDRRRRVIASDGPDCVAGEWWRDDAETVLVREYFRIEDEDGLRLWLFRVSGPDGQHWFVHGVFA